MYVDFPDSMQILIHRSTFMYRLLGFASKNTKHLAVLSKTKDSKGKILSLCYPWVFIHGCQTSRSPGNMGNTRNLAETEKFGFCVTYMCRSTEYQLFSFYPRINQISMHSTFIPINMKYYKG